VRTAVTYFILFEKTAFRVNGVAASYNSGI